MTSVDLTIDQVYSIKVTPITDDPITISNNGFLNTLRETQHSTSYLSDNLNGTKIEAFSSYLYNDKGFLQMTKIKPKEEKQKMIWKSTSKQHLDGQA